MAGASGFTVNPPAAATPPADPNFYVVHSTGVAEITVVQNVVVANGQDTCFNATQSVIIAGNGSGFLVQNGGSATVIAGQNINFLHGTTVEAGGYMHGYITPTNDYCGTIAPPIVAVKAGIAENQVNPDHSSFRIYPNPVTETCTLEYIGKPVPGSTNVEIFGINGVRVFSVAYSNEIYQMLAVEKLAPGVYFVQITTGFVKETIKLIKQ
jgi:hypothetical protein